MSMNKKKKKEPMYNLKTTLFHKVQKYSFDEEEMKIMERAVRYADSSVTYTVLLEDSTSDAVVIAINGVPESEKAEAIKKIAENISWFMYVESSKVKQGLRAKRRFMFKGADECPTEEKLVSK